MKRSSLALAASLALFALHAQAAEDELAVTVTFQIDAVISVTWCNADGSSPVVTAQSWALGTGVALNTIYDTDTGDGTHGLGGTGATAPLRGSIRNIGNTTVAIEALCSDSTSGWLSSTAAGSNAFRMQGRVAGNPYVTIDANTAPGNQLVAGLTTAAGPQPWFLRLSTPTAITVGGGVAQTITVTLIASLDP